MKSKQEMIAKARENLRRSVITARLFSKEALKYKRKHLAAGPGSIYFDDWLRFRLARQTWMQAARMFMEVLS